MVMAPRATTTLVPVHCAVVTLPGHQHRLCMWCWEGGQLSHSLGPWALWGNERRKHPVLPLLCLLGPHTAPEKRSSPTQRLSQPCWGGGAQQEMGMGANAPRMRARLILLLPLKQPKLLKDSLNVQVAGATRQGPDRMASGAQHILTDLSGRRCSVF